MALIINTNIAALNAQRNLSRSQASLNKAIQRLSTGLRINGAVDDAAGLAISVRFTSQIRGLDQASRNANDGISVLQTADGSLQEVSNLLQRARELAVQAANDSNTTDDRSSMNAEVTNIVAELDRLASTVAFNNKKLLDGTFSDQQFQIGANANQTLSFSINSTQTKDLGAAVRVGVAFSTTSIAALQNIKINSTTVGVSGNTTLQGIIDDINAKTDDTKATAVKNTKTVFTSTGFTALTAAASGDVTLTINGVDISLTTGNAGTDATFVTRVNEFSTQTGVIASGVGTAMVLTRAGAGDIVLQEVAGSTAEVGFAAGTANTSDRTFVAGFTLKVDLTESLAVTSGGSALSIIGFGSTTLVNKKVSGMDTKTVTAANDAIQTIDFALTQLNKIRGNLGALQNRFDSVINTLAVASENVSAARSRIQDADVAKETAELTRNQILIQAGVAVLAQANQLPSIALTLLG